MIAAYGSACDAAATPIAYWSGHEDEPMIEDVQRNMGDASLWDLDPVLLSIVLFFLQALLLESTSRRKGQVVGAGNAKWGPGRLTLFEINNR